MTVRNLDLFIETDKNGEHFVVFPRRYENLVAPTMHSEKMAWIRDSFETFFKHVRELDALTNRVG